jgi:hypothetical protein
MTLSLRSDLTNLVVWNFIGNNQSAKTVSDRYTNTPRSANLKLLHHFYCTPCQTRPKLKPPDDRGLDQKLGRTEIFLEDNDFRSIEPTT